MALYNEMNRQGTWLFRHRGYLPLFLVLVLLAGLRNYTYLDQGHVRDSIWETFCFLIAMFGLSVRAYVVGHTPKGTSGRNTSGQVAETLNTAGLYSVVRHPLYLGNFFMWLGVAMFLHQWQVVVVFALVFFLYYERIMIAEESFLQNKFGETYVRWAEQTPAFIPDFSKWRAPDLPFSLRNVLRREYSGFFAVIVIFNLLELGGNFVVNHRLVVNFAWVAVFCFGAFVYITLRTLKRHTRMLDVDGR